MRIPRSSSPTTTTPFGARSTASLRPCRCRGPAEVARNLQIWKFGGASLASADAIRRAVGLIAARSGPLVVVASAFAGVTDLLLDGARQAAAGRAEAPARIAADLLRRHRQIVKTLLPEGAARRRLFAVVDAAAREYHELCGAAAVLGHLEPRASDRLVSRGERLAAACLAAALVAARRKTTCVDAIELVSTDGQYGSAAPDLAQTTRRARRALGPRLAGGSIVVVPGFIGQAPDGSVTTLGRGGSD